MKAPSCAAALPPSRAGLLHAGTEARPGACTLIQA